MNNIPRAIRKIFSIFSFDYAIFEFPAVEFPYALEWCFIDFQNDPTEIDKPFMVHPGRNINWDNLKLSINRINQYSGEVYFKLSLDGFLNRIRDVEISEQRVPMDMFLVVISQMYSEGCLDIYRFVEYIVNLKEVIDRDIDASYEYSPIGKSATDGKYRIDHYLNNYFRELLKSDNDRLYFEMIF